MATTTVSGRVEENTKAIADRYIVNAGLTPNEVIANIWRSIADSGVIPPEAYRGIAGDNDKKRVAASKILSARTRAVAGTPLSAMESADIREELARRD